MRFKLRVGLLVSVFLVISFAVPPSFRAQHVVPPTDIHKELVNATETRTRNREKVNELFSSKDAQKALRGAGVDPGQVKTAVATLSDAEFKALSAHYEDAKILEIIQLCGFYRTVSHLANGLALPLEENAARFPR